MEVTFSLFDLPSSMMQITLSHRLSVSQESQEDIQKDDFPLLKFLKGNFHNFPIFNRELPSRGSKPYLPNPDLPVQYPRAQCYHHFVEAESDVPWDLANEFCRLFEKARLLPSANRKSLLINDSIYHRETRGSYRKLTSSSQMG